MIGLIQRVTHAQVEVDQQVVGKIGNGILALIGIEKSDTEKQAEKLCDRMLNYRIFDDENGKMNVSLKEVSGGLLLVSQFTLVAETNKGTRPGFSTGMPPEEGKRLFEYLVNFAKQHYARAEAGIFGANMQVSLCNDGPVTFILNT